MKPDDDFVFRSITGFPPEDSERLAAWCTARVEGHTFEAVLHSNTAKRLLQVLENPTNMRAYPESVKQVLKIKLRQLTDEELGK